MADTLELTAPTTTRTPSTDFPVLDRLKAAEQAIRECMASVQGEPDVSLVQPVTETLELSVVMPCLNEEDTLGICIEKAQRAMREHQIRGEVIVADNGSTDRSIEIATELGARVVNVEAKGYGNALMGGIEAARGQYVIMGDADDSYDFLEIPKFVDQLRNGHDLVQGCRLPSGGGTVLPGAMPPLHRWWGNPMFTWMVRNMFSAPVHDVYCGLRGFTREHYDRLDLRSTGMEFATEMIIKSSLFQADIAEVPTTLHPDGRKAHAPHLRTFRDGWRTLRFFLMYSPRWCFLVPGVLLAVLGILGYALALPATQVAGVTLDAHTLLVASLAMLVGTQLVQLALFAKTFAISERLVPESPKMRWFRQVATLERGLVSGLALAAGGTALIGVAFASWQAVDFGALDYATTMRWVIPGVTAVALGCQTMFASFFLSVLRMARK
ncbi:glycosyltransferase family 2 protein [Aeoliella mucimassa]|uniref:Undecaprenyl-phosphate 4-deoxy-4-formamido-L-arabinose transferase n=1 Tax=Aeoliella mucimassa TaxID=2527972 RepID=A0A518AW91_9BACT|nr:glycosyltransferase family 2 protein [Aeoliella mucimassa]QDU58994.1 Undecaprenyl-phosphate 4-deoxy-4-formamido-L-arabinose transferase [Aeoliella mucimassa]